MVLSVGIYEEPEAPGDDADARENVTL